jgi:hypothetical protein
MGATGPWRRSIALAGYFGVGFLLFLHCAFWTRAQALHGFWGHLNEAGRWFQLIDIASLLVTIFCLLGTGWKRWMGSFFGFASLLLSCIYAVGL